ncbi:MAG: ABC transporter permease [Chloroflexota bacterium]|nr:MAG: ABC transporter permease [Chloroflexota bacterium]
MRFVGLLLAALDGVAAHRGRALLGVLSIVVGVASVSLVVAIGDVGRAAAQAILERQSGRPATFAVSLAVPGWAPADPATIAERLATLVTSAGGQAARVLRSDGFLEREGARHSIGLVGTDPTFAAIRRVRLVAGRWLRPDDGGVLGPVLALNRVAAADVGLAEATPLPASVVLDVGRRVAGLVVGIVDDGEPYSRAYLPVAGLVRWSDTPGQPLLLVWVAPERSGPVLDRLSGLASRLEVTTEVQRTDDPRAADELIRIIQLILGAVAALSLVTGGIGVVNLALAMVDQRTKEFAIRRAFGASRRDIFVIVLFESVVTVGVGGVAGVGIALAGGAAVGLVLAPILGLDEVPAPPFSTVVLGLLVTVGLGIAVGIVPARRATSRSVIRAIRD